MCLILFRHDPDAAIPLAVAANRDEFHGRPTREAGWWRDDAGLFAGRDLQAGGTWLGVHRGPAARAGRFAAVTNFSAFPPKDAPRSRGDLVADFLRSDASCADFLADLTPTAHEYRGFNLLVHDGLTMCYFSNRQDRGADADGRVLAPGVYGLSNDLLDCGWHKVVQGKQRLGELLDGSGRDQMAPGRLTDQLLALVTDRLPAPDGALPQRGRDPAMEKKHSACFIQDATYGTRASSIVLVTQHGLDFTEQSYGPSGATTGRVDERIPWRWDAGQTE